MGRHERRVDIARFRRDASRALLTYLIEPNDGALIEAPLLRRAAHHWLDALPARVRHCIVCNLWIVNRHEVGALLMSTPDTIRPTSVGTAAVCSNCWNADLPAEALERAAESVLRAVIPNGRFEPH
jgi:hypothetical protein